MHPMARSVSSAKSFAAEDHGHADVLIEPRGPRKYRVRFEADRLWHHEFLADSTGDVLYDQSLEVSYALGSGTRGKAFLIEREGRLFASPLNWYASKNQWGLAPGYAPEFHKRFERETGDGCLVCHAGRLNQDPDSPNVYRSPIFLEMAIGCERCHGPGQRHIDFHTPSRAVVEATQAAASRSDPIINPRQLEPAQREAVCNQCHLQGQFSQLRHGRHAFDFRPGMRLEDVWMVFVDDTHTTSGGPIRAVNQVEQMRASVCFSQSNGRLGCLSCHDAHMVPAPAERADFYRSRCVTCHAESDCRLPDGVRQAAPARGSCIACHMPPLETRDVPHTAQTDHRILRQPLPSPTPTPAESDGPSPERWVMFDGAEQRLPEWEARRAQGLAWVGLAEKKHDLRSARDAASLLRSILEVAPNDAETLEAFGVTQALQGRATDARKTWQAALATNPHRESLLVRLAFVCHDLGDLVAAADYFDRLLKLNPWHAAFHGRQAHILGLLGKLDAAILEAERAVELDPTLSQAHDWLAKAYELRQQRDLSEQHRNQARKLRDLGF